MVPTRWTESRYQGRHHQDRGGATKMAVAPQRRGRRPKGGEQRQQGKGNEAAPTRQGQRHQDGGAAPKAGSGANKARATRRQPGVRIRVHPG
eukprot:365205-Chlamydomonas_euryale.AAC.12